MVRSSEYIWFPFVLAPFWQRHLKCALIHTSVGLLWFQMLGIFLTRRNTDKECILVSPLLGVQNRRECQRIQNLAIASEELRRGRSCASKGDVKPNDLSIWKKTSNMRSRTPLTCFSSEEAFKTMVRSRSLCRIFRVSFTRPVMLQLSGSMIPLLSAKEIPLNSSLWNLPFEFLIASTLREGSKSPSALTW